MADIFQEVDEEVRRDKAAEFWKKYQNLILGAALLIVLAAAGFRYWQYEKEKAEQAAGAQFQAAIAAVEAGKLDEANGGLAKLAAEAPGGYRVLAQMTEAGDKAASDAPASIAAFDAIAGDASVDPLFRDAARLRAALIRLDRPGEEQAGAAALDLARRRRGAIPTGRALNARRTGAVAGRVRRGGEAARPRHRRSGSLADRTGFGRAMARTRRLEPRVAQVILRRILASVSSWGRKTTTISESRAHGGSVSPSSHVSGGSPHPRSTRLRLHCPRT